MAEYIPLDEYEIDDDDEDNDLLNIDDNQQTEETSFIDDNLPSPIKDNDYPKIDYYDYKGDKKVIIAADINYYKKAEDRLINYLYEKYKTIGINSRIEIFVGKGAKNPNQLNVYAKLKNDEKWVRLTVENRDKLTFLKINSKEFITNHKDLYDYLVGDFKNKTLLPNLEQTQAKTIVESAMEIMNEGEDEDILVDDQETQTEIADINIPEIRNNPVVAQTLIRIEQLAKEYQKLHDEEREIMNDLSKQERYIQIKNVEIPRIEKLVTELFNIQLKRDIDLAKGLPLITRIRLLFEREGLTFVAIAGALGMIISTTFAIVFGNKNTPMQCLIQVLVLVLILNQHRQK